jgi:hypothetical protein
VSDKSEYPARDKSENILRVINLNKRRDMKRRCNILTYLILVCLLHPVSAGAGGFYVPRERGRDTFGSYLLYGGMYRWQNNVYVKSEEALFTPADFNFVEGMMLGPQFTVGRVMSNGARWETGLMGRYSFSRNGWQGEGALRYYAPIDADFRYEVSGGDITTDFNGDAFLRGGQAALARSLFGWDHTKFYRKTHLTARAEGSVARDVVMGGWFGWQRRAALSNHRLRSFFGSIAAPNVPENYLDMYANTATPINTAMSINADAFVNTNTSGGTDTYKYNNSYVSSKAGGASISGADTYKYNNNYVPSKAGGAAISGADTYKYNNSCVPSKAGGADISGADSYNNGYTFPTTEVLKAGISVAYTPHRRLVVLSDMRSQTLSAYPTFTAEVEATTGMPRAHHSLGSLRRRERWQVGVNQQLSTSLGRLSYQGEVGCFTGKRDGLLVDMKHFSASRFGWQQRESLTWMQGLHDYQLSTDRSWALLATSLQSNRLLLLRWLSAAGWRQDDIAESLSLRLLQVEKADLHTEVGYAWSLRRALTLGICWWWNASRYDGAGVRLVTVLP